MSFIRMIVIYILWNCLFYDFSFVIILFFLFFPFFPLFLHQAHKLDPKGVAGSAGQEILDCLMEKGIKKIKSK